MVDGESNSVFSSVHRLPFITHNFSRRRSSTESEHRATNAKVAGSSPAVFTNFNQTILRPARAVSQPPAADRQLSFRGRLTGRTSGSEPGNMGSTPIPEAKILYRGPAYPLSGRSTDGYMGLFWKQVFAGSNPAARTKFSFACSPIGRGAGLRNRRLRVRISPRVPVQCGS